MITSSCAHTFSLKLHIATSNTPTHNQYKFMWRPTFYPVGIMGKQYRVTVSQCQTRVPKCHVFDVWTVKEEKEGENVYLNTHIDKGTMGKNVIDDQVEYGPALILGLDWNSIKLHFCGWFKIFLKIHITEMKL